MYSPRNRKKARKLSHVGKGIRCVKDVTDNFCCDALTTLNLHANEISTFDGLRELRALTDLNLSANRITKLQGFPVLPLLETLNLASNGLKTCEGMPRLPKLRTLILSHNDLTHIRGLHALNGGPLTVLDVRGNPMQPSSGYPELRGLTALEIFRCDALGLGAATSVAQSGLSVVEDDSANHVQKQLNDTSNHGTATFPPRSFDRKLPDPRSCPAPSNDSPGTPIVSSRGGPPSVVTGYPAAQQPTEYVARVNQAVQTEASKPQTRDACTSRVVELKDNSSSTEDCCSTKGRKSVSVEADLPTSEAEQLKVETHRLKDRVEWLKEELDMREKKQMKIENEFLSKIQALKERSAERLKQQKEHAAQEANKKKEICDTEVKNLQKKITEAEDVIQTLKELSKKTHSELEREKRSHAEIAQHLHEEKTGLEDKIRDHQLHVEELQNRHVLEVSDSSKKLAAANEELIKKAGRIEELETSLTEVSAELAAAQQQATDDSVAHDSKIKGLENELERSARQIQNLQESEDEQKTVLLKEQQDRASDRETHQKAREHPLNGNPQDGSSSQDVTRLKNAFEADVAKAAAQAFKEGELRGKQTVDDALRRETVRLRETFSAVESKMKEALTDCEARNANLRDRLKLAEGKAGELQTALVGGMQRSKQQEDVIKEMRAVLQTQKQTIQSLKEETLRLSAQADACSVSNLNALKTEIASLKGSSEKAVGLQSRLETVEGLLREREEELKALGKEKHEALREAEKTADAMRDELQRLRIKNRELVGISECIQRDKQSLADAFKVKEAMMESANATIAELKADAVEAQREMSELQQRLDDAESEVLELRSAAARESEKYKQDVQRVTESMEEALLKEEETSKILRERLEEKTKEYEEKKQAICEIEGEISAYKTKCADRIQKAESEKKDALAKLQTSLNSEERLKGALSDLEAKAAKLHEGVQVESSQKQKILEAALKLREEKRALNDRIKELECDMKRLLLSLERDRTQSVDKMQQLERILTELRLPLLRGA